MKILFTVFFFLYSQLYAASLDELISNAIEKSPSLEVISHRISAAKSNTALSKEFSNPTISLAKNTLDDSQAMSRTTFGFKQKIPYFGKRDVQEDIALADEAILQQNLNQSKAILVGEIKKTAYEIWRLESHLGKILEYEKLTRQRVELFESYTSISSSQHTGIMSAELTLSDLSIEKNILESQIQSAYSKLSYLSFMEVDNLSIDLGVADMMDIKTLQNSISKNPALLIKEEEIKKYKNVVKARELDFYPDINILASYDYRENFDNFASFGIAIELPIYSRESYKEQESRSSELSAVSAKKDVALLVESRLQGSYYQMLSSYNTYHIVNDKALPQIEHMFELLNSSVSTGEDLFKYIDILVKRLKLEQRSIESVSSYNKARADISALLGEIR